jgi:hypothetical protein
MELGSSPTVSGLPSYRNATSACRLGNEFRHVQRTTLTMQEIQGVGSQNGHKMSLVRLSNGKLGLHRTKPTQGVQQPFLVLTGDNR